MSRSRRVKRTISIVHPVSDKSKLLWERYYIAMNGAAQAFNAAIVNTQNILGRIIIEAEGFDPDTHIFDADNLRIVSRPNLPLTPQLAPHNDAVE
jgi:hypothetical protein